VIDPVVCVHCGRAFEPPAAARGGLANCPACGKAVDVPGLRDPMWRLLQTGGVLLALLAGWLAAGAFGPAAGVAIGVGALGLLWLSSRAL
jgi:hypothetical protein